MKVIGIDVHNTINCAMIEVSLQVADNITTTVSVRYNPADDSWVLKDKLLELIDLIGLQEQRFES